MMHNLIILHIATTYENPTHGYMTQIRLNLTSPGSSRALMQCNNRGVATLVDISHSEPDNLLGMASMFAHGLLESQTEVTQGTHLHPANVFQKIHCSLCTYMRESMSNI
jgi:hypothetical protein